jgi:hypothetical protein
VRRLRIIPALDESEWAVRWAQTRTGRVVLLLVFLLSLAVHVRSQLLFDTGVILALIATFPAHRRTILTFSALYWAAVHVPFRWELLAALRQRTNAMGELPDFRVFSLTVIAAVFLFCALTHRFLQSRPPLLVARQPAWALVGGYALLLLIVSFAPFNGIAWLYMWAFTLIGGHYLWFLAYALIDLRKPPHRGFYQHLGAFHPFWGSTNTPFPKGAEYLDRIEAKEPLSLAVSQLKGLKLLWWSIVLLVVATLSDVVFHGRPWPFGTRPAFVLPIPPLAVAFRASVAGQPLPWHQNCLAMLLDLLLDGLKLSIWGHQYVAVARMAGFNARRNTYKPFLATNVSEFFNRYYYYFKELLVDCFFFPVFYAIPRRHLKLGLFVATVSAAGIGNYAYHFFRDVHVTVVRGLGRALIDSHMLLLYCVLLATTIFVSQVRRMARAKQPRSMIINLRATLLVWLVFALLNSLIVDLWNSNLAQHARFLADSLPWPVG